jgi:hypothetical protein
MAADSPAGQLRQAPTAAMMDGLAGSVWSFTELFDGGARLTGTRESSATAGKR